MAGIEKNWKNYGNLLFHNGLSTSVQASNRFFYFSTLLDSSYARNNNPDYTKKANAIGKNAQQVLKQNLPTPNNDHGWIEKYKNIINFLQNGIRYEQNNEKRYFEQKLKLFEKNFTAEERAASPELQSIYNLLNKSNLNEGFDYISFIIQLNILLQGFDNTKEIFKFEENRLKDLEERLNKMRNQRRNQLEGFFKDYNNAEDRIEKALHQFDNERIHAYMENKSISSIRGFKTNFKGIKGTSSVEISHWITDILNRILNSKNFLNTIINIIVDKGIVIDKKEAEAKIKPILIKTIVTYATKNIDQILSGDIYKKKTNQILKELEDSIDLTMDMHIEGYYDNFGQFGRHLDFFKKGLQGILEQNQSASGLEEMVERLLHDSQKTFHDKTRRRESEAVLQILGKGEKNERNIPKRVQELRQFENQIERIEKWIEKQKKAGKTSFTPKDYDTIKLGKNNITISLDKEGNLSIKSSGGIKKGKNSFIDTIFSNGTRATTPRTLIQSSKKQLSKMIKIRLEEEIKSIQPKEQQKLYELLEKAVQNLTISVGGPTYEEIKLGVQESILNRLNSNLTWSGKINLKNDFFEVFVSIPDENIEKTFQEYQNNEVQNLFKIMQEYIMIQKNNINNEFSNKILNIMNSFSKEKKYGEYEEYGEKIKEEYDELLKKDEVIDKELDKIIQQFIFEHSQYGKDQKFAELVAKKKQDFLNSLKDSFLISSTMKTLNTYQNDIGFIGGSLGSNIINQINHLNQLFTAAGMPMSSQEINWLIFAIINTSPVSVIGENNKNIIENYLGSIAAFAMFDEAALELNVIQDNINIDDSPNILHLYGLNGIYFPGSYILSQILDSVKAMLNLINGNLIEEEIHNGIIITNNTNFQMVPNQKSQFPIDEHPWQTVSKKAITATKVDMVFMAGLLAIVENLNDQLNEIRLPL